MRCNVCQSTSMFIFLLEDFFFICQSILNDKIRNINSFYFDLKMSFEIIIKNLFLDLFYLHLFINELSIITTLFSKIKYFGGNFYILTNYSVVV